VKYFCYLIVNFHLLTFSYEANTIQFLIISGTIFRHTIFSVCLVEIFSNWNNFIREDMQLIDRKPRCYALTSVWSLANNENLTTSVIQL